MHQHDKEIRSRAQRHVARVAAFGLLALGAAVGGSFTQSASAAAAPNCFGSFVAYSAQNAPSILGTANLGQFVSNGASGPGVYGQDAVPFYKSLACG